MRLGLASLDDLPPGIRRPGYDPAVLTPGIVHLGLGAFSRCHLTEYTEDALEHAFGPWGIRAINLRPPALEPMLDPQDRLYIRELRDGPDRNRRVIGAISDVMTVRDNKMLARALSRLVDPAIRVVTMTVTEKGYCHVPATGMLDFDHPDIRHDIADPANPVSLPGFVVAAIRLARAAGQTPPAFLSCDNVPGNGSTLRRCVLAFARASGFADPDFIEDQVAFPDTMVDRIVPATTANDVADLQAETGIEDQALVVGEPFRMWVIGADTRMTLPPWDSAGAIITPDVVAYEVIKMRVLNGMQTGLVHLAHMAGHATTAGMMADPLFLSFARRTMRDEVRPSLPRAEGIDHDEYIAQSIARLENTALQHTTAQIATDGSRKIRQRLLEALRDALADGRTAPGLEIEVAGWIEHITRFAVSDMRITDPMIPMVQDILSRTANATGPTTEAILALETVFPPALVATPGLAGRLVALVAAIREAGPKAVMAAHMERS